MSKFIDENGNTTLNRTEYTNKYKEWIKDNPKEFAALKKQGNQWEALQNKLSKKFGNAFWREDLSVKGRSSIIGSMPTKDHPGEPFRIKGSANNIQFMSVSRRNATRGGATDLDVQNTTLDPVQYKAYGKVNPEGGPVHHAVHRGIMAKMLKQFELNLNPKWKETDGPSQQGKNFLRILEKKYGLSGGHSLANLRSYPPDNPAAPKVSKVHTKAHELGRLLDIDAKRSFKGYTNQQLMDYAKNTLAPAVAAIDKELGYKPNFKKRGIAGAFLRGMTKVKDYSSLVNFVKGENKGYERNGVVNGKVNGVVNGKVNGVVNGKVNGVVNGKVNGKPNFLSSLKRTKNRTGISGVAMDTNFMDDIVKQKPNTIYKTPRDTFFAPIPTRNDEGFLDTNFLPIDKV